MTTTETKSPLEYRSPAWLVVLEDGESLTVIAETCQQAGDVVDLARALEFDDLVISAELPGGAITEIRQLTDGPVLCAHAVPVTWIALPRTPTELRSKGTAHEVTR